MIVGATVPAVARSSITTLHHARPQIFALSQRAAAISLNGASERLGEMPVRAHAVTLFIMTPTLNMGDHSPSVANYGNRKHLTSLARDGQFYPHFRAVWG
eukprot:gene60988-81314_t